MPVGVPIGLIGLVFQFLIVHGHADVPIGTTIHITETGENGHHGALSLQVFHLADGMDPKVPGVFYEFVGGRQFIVGHRHRVTDCQGQLIGEPAVCHHFVIRHAVGNRPGCHEGIGRCTACTLDAIDQIGECTRCTRLRQGGLGHVFGDVHPIGFQLHDVLRVGFEGEAGIGRSPYRF